MTILHNPKCSKSRECINILNEMNVKFEIIEYLKNPPSKIELQDIVNKLGISDIRDMMRNKEDEYNAEDLANISKTNDQLLDAMVKYPKLIERPICINNNKAAIGRPMQNILDII